MTKQADIVEIVQRNLTLQLERTGRSASAVSTAAGLSETAIRDMLRRTKQGPRVSSLKQIADELGCSVMDLLTDPDAPPAPTSAADDDGDFVKMERHERGRVRLHLNQLVTTDQFMQIMAILEESDS